VPDVRTGTRRLRRLIRPDLAAVLILCCALVGCSGPASHPGADVYLLLVDTLRADHLSVYGYARPTSPELERLAASATVYQNVVAAAPWTLPSVGSLFTGTYPTAHGLRAQRGAPAFVIMRKGVTTLAETFQAAGYRTVAIVTNPWLVGGNGLERGFESYTAEVDAPASRVHELARNALAVDDGRPTFLYLHYMDVHGPYRSEAAPAELLEPPASSRPLTRAELSRMPGYLRLSGPQTLARYVDAYDHGIWHWDREVGAFFDWLDANDRLRDAVVSVVSDHGEELAERGGWNHGETVFEEQIAVPWLLWLPRPVAAEDAAGVRRRDEPSVVSLIDVAPTLLSSVGVEPPAGMLGRDLHAAPAPADRALGSETEARLGGIRDAFARRLALRRGQEKISLGPAGHACFDLDRDPGERSPATCPQRLIADLDAWVELVVGLEQRSAGAGQRPMTDAERDRLRALGYLE